MRVLANFRCCNVRFSFRASASTWRSTSTTCTHAAHICQPSSTHVGQCDTKGRSDDPSQASASLSSISFQLRSRSTRVMLNFKNSAMAWPKRTMTSRQFPNKGADMKIKSNTLYQQQWREKRRMRQLKGRS